MCTYLFMLCSHFANNISSNSNGHLKSSFFLNVFSLDMFLFMLWCMVHRAIFTDGLAFEFFNLKNVLLLPGLTF